MDLSQRLEDLRDHLISNENLSRLKIGVSDLPLEVEDGSLDFGARFFAPLPPDALQTSPCTLCSNNGIHGPVFRRPESPIPSYLQSDYEEDQMYFTGRYLAKVISTHCSHTALEYPSEWRCVSHNPHYYRGARCTENRVKTGENKHREHMWVVPSIFDRFSKEKPHLMLIMASDHGATDQLLKVEIIAMVSYMLSRMLSKTRRKHIIHPVLVVSILKPLQVRVLQGYFNGSLHVRCSKLSDFHVSDHEDPMTLVVRWLMSKPHGDTTVHSLLSTPEMDGDVNTTDPSQHDRGEPQECNTSRILPVSA